MSDELEAGVEQIAGQTLTVWQLDNGMWEFTHPDIAMPYLLDPSTASEARYWELLAWALRMA